MKYEAKADNGSGVGDTSKTTGFNTWPADTYPISASRKLVSTVAGYPVTNISQATAITAALNYTTSCPSGCHLITKAEYLTIAQNVLNVSSNWYGGVVGTNYIYSGHNDNSPANALEASTDDNNGYFGTGNSSSSGASQRRTLNLSNGEIIWDIVGDVREWTTGTITGNQPGILGAGFAFRDYTTLTTHGTLSPDPFPATTGIFGANTWTLSKGIGQIDSSADDTSLRGFVRGSCWLSGNSYGILNLLLNYSPSDKSNQFGLRVTK